MTPVRFALRELRKRAGLSQVELAKKLGVRQATVSDLETGKTQAIDLKLLEKIARILDVGPTALYQSSGQASVSTDQAMTWTNNSSFTVLVEVPEGMTIAGFAGPGPYRLQPGRSFTLRGAPKGKRIWLKFAPDPAEAEED